MRSPRASARRSRHPAALTGRDVDAVARTGFLPGRVPSEAVRLLALARFRL